MPQPRRGVRQASWAAIARVGRSRRRCDGVAVAGVRLR